MDQNRIIAWREAAGWIASVGPGSPRTMYCSSRSEAERLALGLALVLHRQRRR